MKKRTFAMDRVLAGIVQQAEFASFTISELRTAYESTLKTDSQRTSSDVRRYVYKQVGRMRKLGWLTKTGKPMSRDAIYERGEFPSGAVLELIEPTFCGKMLPDAFAKSEIDRSNFSTPVFPDQCLLDIEARLNRARMDFIAKVGEAETYKSLLIEHPELRDKLETSYLESRNESSNLMGQLRALEQTIKILGNSHDKVS